MSIVIADIISEYGPYVNRGQNKNKIKQLLFQTPETAAGMTSYQTENDIEELGVGSLTEDFIQAFQQAWTPKGDITIVPNKLILDHIKIDMEVDPYKIVGSWLEFLRKGALDPTKFPLIAYIVQEYVIPRIQSNIELKGIFKGKTGAITPGTATGALASMNGLKVKLIAGVKDTTMNKVALGTLSASNIFEKVEEFASAIAEVYQGVPMEINMSKNWEYLYKIDRRNTFNYPTQLDATVDGRLHTVKGLASMAGEDIMFATPKENKFYLYKDQTNQSVFQIEGSKRLVNLYTDFKLGTGFGINQAVWSYIPESLLV